MLGAHPGESRKLSSARAFRAASAVAALAFVLGACTKSSNTAASAPPVVTTAPSAAASAAPTTTAGDKLPEGRNFGYIKAMDASNHTLVLDLAYFYTGAAAKTAAQQDGQSLDTDYYIRNKNTKLYTVAYSSSAGVKVVDWKHCCDVKPMTLSAFVALFKPGGANDQYHGPNSQYWVTVSGGTIFKIEEQYLP